jgi:hypothetical protein
MVQTVSLKLAKQLKQKGFPQDTDFFWHNSVNVFGEAMDKPLITYDDPDNGKCEDEGHKHNYVAAPTAEEIIKFLPHYIHWDNSHADSFLRMGKGIGGTDFDIFYRGTPYESRGYKNIDSIYGDTLAEAAGKMFLYLKKEELL